MKIYRGTDGFYDMVGEAEKFEKTYDDYSTGTSQYVTSIYESDSHIYKVLFDIDNGVYHSVEKIER